MIANQSASVICSNGFGSYVPRLFTRMSTPGKRRVASIEASALARSSARGSSVAEGTAARMAASASVTRFSLRPLRMTRAPSAARPLAIAKPMPAVEPVTRASLSWSWRFMINGSSFGRPAAIDRQRLAGDEGRFVRAQPEDRFGDFLGLAGAANRVHGGNLGVRLSPGSAREPVEHRCLNAARGDGVDADALRRVFEGGGLGETEHGVLAGRVNGH